MYAEGSGAPASEQVSPVQREGRAADRGGIKRLAMDATGRSKGRGHSPGGGVEAERECSGEGTCPMWKGSRRWPLTTRARVGA